MSEIEAMDMALRFFLRNARNHDLTCYDCGMLYWLTLDSCPNCGRKYPSTLDDRKDRQILIFQEYEKDAIDIIKYRLSY